MGNDKDAFWNIALADNDNNVIGRRLDWDDENGYGTELDADNQHSTHNGLEIESTRLSKKYELDVTRSTCFPNPVRINLSPLPKEDGAWSTLGADAWYGSAVLSALLLRKDGGFIRTHLDKFLRTTAITALELGSGAVGLSGVALMCLLARDSTDVIPSSKRDRVLLTDIDVDVLGTLGGNMKRVFSTLNAENPSIHLPDVRIQNLDWKYGCGRINDPDTITEHIPSITSIDTTDIHLVIGSELVYSIDTAMSCIKIVMSLLENYTNILIVIVQVSDRDGWNSCFLPAIKKCAENDKQITIRVEDPIADAHDLHCEASKLIQPGGTLDRCFDYGACYIWNI